MPMRISPDPTSGRRLCVKRFAIRGTELEQGALNYFDFHVQRLIDGMPEYD